MSEIFDDDLCDDDLLNDLCAVFIGGALRDRDLDRDLERPPPRPPDPPLVRPSVLLVLLL